MFEVQSITASYWKWLNIMLSTLRFPGICTLAGSLHLPLFTFQVDTSRMEPHHGPWSSPSASSTCGLSSRKSSLALRPILFLSVVHSIFQIGIIPTLYEELHQENTNSKNNLNISKLIQDYLWLYDWDKYIITYPRSIQFGGHIFFLGGGGILMGEGARSDKSPSRPRRMWERLQLEGSAEWERRSMLHLAAKPTGDPLMVNPRIYPKKKL